MTQNLGESRQGGARKAGAFRRKRSTSEMDRSMVCEWPEGEAGTGVLGRWTTVVMGWYTYLPTKTHRKRERDRNV